MTLEKLYTIPEVAEMWGVTERLVKDLAKAGDLNHYVIGRRELRFSESHLKAYLKKSTKREDLWPKKPN